MGEIHRVMVEDACTKDVFRELDGFLLIVNVLAILHDFLDESDSSVTQTEEGERLVFMLLAESLKGHSPNQVYLQVRTKEYHLCSPIDEGRYRNMLDTIPFAKLCLRSSKTVGLLIKSSAFFFRFLKRTSLYQVYSTCFANCNKPTSHNTKPC